MTLIQRQSKLVQALEAMHSGWAGRGYGAFMQDELGKRSKAMRQHADAMQRDGYTLAQGYESARQCLDVALLNLQHAGFSAAFGVGAKP